MKRVLALALAFLGACTPGRGDGFGTWSPPITATPEIAALERAMFGRLNRDRAGAGLPPLEYDEALADVARAHSLDMRDHDFLAHESPTTGSLDDRMDRAGLLAHEMRENLAIAADVEGAEDSLLDSPGHRANIMADSVTHVGIGLVKGSPRSPDMLTITQVFAAPAELQAPDDVVDGIRTRIDQARRKAGLPPLKPHALLDELAEDHVGDLADALPEGSAAGVSESVTQALSRAYDHGLGSIQVVAQLVWEADELAPPSAALEASATHVGIAATEGLDDRGRPKVKVLVLVGRGR